ncbi:GerAB/ArcD/ProY family transporter [Paenibacillus gansuensis]|uniref:Endospore germination permease n=1 Tax=Paenibacillus gansuensis TaxID=306542 RepID=A0ABW5PC86_9BACL
MKIFDYADERIGLRELAITVISIIIGIGVLTLPRLVAAETISSDGWISILLAGGISAACAWLLACLGIRIGKKSYPDFAASVVGKPLSVLFSALFVLYAVSFCAYEVRAIGTIAKQYLFEQTPTEMVALTFLLVVVYAVSGSRIGLIRLNVLFLPIVFGIVLLVLVFGISLVELRTLKPLLVSSPMQIWNGTKEGIYSFLGFEIVLFYAGLMKTPGQAKSAAVIGVSITTLLYAAVYIFCVGIFSHDGLTQITYPLIELAKEAQIPGEFFERFESVFFTIWIMTIFNTTTLYYDLSVSLLQSMFKKTARKSLIYTLSPVIMYVSMLPQNQIGYSAMGQVISYLGLAAGVALPILLLFAAKWKEGHTRAKTAGKPEE